MTDPSQPLLPQLNWAVRGRWEIQTLYDGDDGPQTVAWGEFVPKKVPVVPCDAEAVRRVAWTLASEQGVGWLFSEHGPEGPDAARARLHFHERARACLRAAGAE